MLIQVTPDNIESIHTTMLGDGNEDSGPEDVTTYTATFTVSEASFAKRNVGTRTTHSTATQSTRSINQEMIDEFIFTTKAIGQTSSAGKGYRTVPLLFVLLWVLLMLM